MHPSSILSYYPNYAILDEIVDLTNCKTLNIFMDLKNNLQTLYLEHAIINILELSERSKFVDTSIFSSVLSFLSFHKIYSIKRNIDINFFIFFESGVSYYHKNLHNKYKISRKVDDLYGLDREKREKFFEILQRNFMLIDKACNLMPCIKVIRLPNLEADFVPYYVITRKLINQENNANIVYSNDHDMYQCANENTFIFSKSAKSKKIVKQNKIISTYFKFDVDIPDEYLPLAMAIIGDTGDDVYGIKGIGAKRFSEIFNELHIILGSMDIIYDKISKNISIFPDNFKHENKYLNTIYKAEKEENKITTNLKLVSFELLSRELDSPNKTEMLDKKKIIENILFKENSYVPINVMKEALVKNGVYLGDDSLDVVYYKT